jgi:predicted acetyltransferase
MTTEVRRVRDEEFDAWCDAIDVGFNSPQERGGASFYRRFFDLDRCWGAFDAGRPVGTFRGISFDLTLPGGAFVPIDGISSVTVSATHRRQGLLSRMMSGELAAARERGEALVALIAAEWPIYGRFGFGAATEAARWTLDAGSARFDRELPGSVELVDVPTARAEAPGVYDRLRAATPGAVSRADYRWEMNLGLLRRDEAHEPRDVLLALCRDETGSAVGYVRYKISRQDWVHQRPNQAIEILDLIAVGVEYEARLWKYLADHDWVSEVVGPDSGRGDELWRDLLVDRRTVWSGNQWEGQWLRIIDPVTALAGRRYEVPGRVVLRILDKDGFAEGTFAVEGGPDGAWCAPTGESPEITLPARALGSLYLGEYSAARFAQAGLIEEHRTGAIARFGAMFHTAIAPWTPTTY